MKFTAKNFVAWAQSQVGYKGKKTNAQLDDFDANTAGKYNKYSAEIDSFYDPQTKTPLNGRKNGYDWCTLFILDGAYQIIGDINQAFIALYQKGNNCAAGAPWMAKFFKSYKRYDQNPQIGDVGFVEINDSANSHVCIVSAIDGDKITTIDGNWALQVKVVTRDISEFSGFGHPNFVEDESEPEDTITISRAEYDEMKADIATLKEVNASLNREIIDSGIELLELQDKYNDLRNRVNNYLEAFDALRE